MVNIESLTRDWISLLRKDRDKLRDDRGLDTGIQLLSLIGDTDLRLILSREGKNNIPFYFIWRRGCRLVKDLTRQDLDSISRYIEERKRPKIERAVLCHSGNAIEALRYEYFVHCLSRPLD